MNNIRSNSKEIHLEYSSQEQFVTAPSSIMFYFMTLRCINIIIRTSSVINNFIGERNDLLWNACAVRDGMPTSQPAPG